jgi:hypothetical protein
MDITEIWYEVGSGFNLRWGQLVQFLERDDGLSSYKKKKTRKFLITKLTTTFSVKFVGHRISYFR